MIELSFVLAVLIAFIAGLYCRVFWDKVEGLEAKLAAKIKPDKEPEPESTFLDPDDVVQRARFEQEEIRRQLNPEE